MLGLQILERCQCVSTATVEAYRGLPVATISDCLHRLFAAGAPMRPMHWRGLAMAGAAITVRTRPGDNLLIHKALSLAGPGDVLVVDGGGELCHALVGEQMVERARKAGLAGFVINGAIRDSAAIAEGDFPVYALGVTHRGPLKSGPGEINTAVAFGGMVVSPGDLVLGDADGVLSLPAREAEPLLPQVRARMAAEAEALSAIANGSYDESWIDQALAQIGLPPSPRQD